MPRKRRQIERVVFNGDEPKQVVAYMARLGSAEDGWINLIPRISDDDDRPTSLRFFTLFSGGSTGDTMCTWIPGSHNRRGLVQPTLGIAHATGRRVFAELPLLDVPIRRLGLSNRITPAEGSSSAFPPTNPVRRSSSGHCGQPVRFLPFRSEAGGQMSTSRSRRDT